MTPAERAAAKEVEREALAAEKEAAEKLEAEKERAERERKGKRVASDNVGVKTGNPALRKMAKRKVIPDLLVDKTAFNAFPSEVVEWIMSIRGGVTCLEIW